MKGTGSPKTRKDSPGMFRQMPPGIAHERRILGGLPGGLGQIVLPFVPWNHIRDEEWLQLA